MFTIRNTLYRSMNNAYLAGVCGGLADYIRVDPSFVRIFFILLAFGNGIGILIYFVLWLVIPLEGQPRGISIRQNVQNGGREIAEKTRLVQDDIRSVFQKPYTQLWTIFGSTLLFFGVVYLSKYFHISWLRWVKFEFLWPALLLMGGLLLLLRHPNGGGSHTDEWT